MVVIYTYSGNMGNLYGHNVTVYRYTLRFNRIAERPPEKSTSRLKMLNGEPANLTTSHRRKK